MIIAVIRARQMDFPVSRRVGVFKYSAVLKELDSRTARSCRERERKKYMYIAGETGLDCNLFGYYSRNVLDINNKGFVTHIDVYLHNREKDI